jgi:hypothetical protein
VEYFLDGNLVSTQKTDPFSFKFDTNSLRNGTYAMVVKTYYNTGTIDSRTEKLLINNKITLAYVVRHFIVNIMVLVAILVVLGVVIFRLVIPRFASRKDTDGSPDHDALYGFAPGSSSSDQTDLVASDPLVVSPVGQISDSPSSNSNSDLIAVPTATVGPQVANIAMNTPALPMSSVSVLRDVNPVLQPGTLIAASPVQSPPVSPVVSSPAITRSTIDILPRTPVAPPTVPAAPVLEDPTSLAPPLPSEPAHVPLGPTTRDNRFPALGRSASASASTVPVQPISSSVSVEPLQQVQAGPSAAPFSTHLRI